MPDAYRLFRTGSAYLAVGNAQAALEPLQQAAELEPAAPSVAEALGRTLFLTGQLRQAADVFTRLVELQPTNDFGLFCLGRCEARLGRDALALGHLQQAVALQPNRADYRRYRDQVQARLLTEPRQLRKDALG